MNPLIQTLIELQEALCRIAEAQRQESEVPLRLQALDRALQQAAEGLNAAREELASVQKERRRLEMEVGSIEAQISRHQDQLFAVKTNEAYRALQHEIDQERAKVRAVEDRILDLMERSDALTERIRLLEKEHGVERDRVEVEKKTIEEQGGAAARERERLSVLRAGLEQRLPREVLDAFHRIARQRGGLGIVRAQNELCGGCNVRLRPQVYQELRAGETLFTCDSCKRYLYVAEERRSEAGGGTGAAGPAGGAEEGHVPAGG